MSEKNRIKYVFLQLGEHLPYSVFGVTVGIVLMGILTFFAIIMRAEDRLPEASEELFHIFHPTHILLSAITTTAMFWKHEKRIFKALVIGFVGSVGICSLSDIFFPFVGGQLIGGTMSMHICLIEHPNLIIPFALIGILVGFIVPGVIEKSTQYSHSAHVLISSMASIIYLVAFGLQDWIHLAGGVFFTTVIAVVIPCCVSDIVFPLVCVHRGCDHPNNAH